jgi:hypothetical protein
MRHAGYVPDGGSLVEIHWESALGGGQFSRRRKTSCLHQTLKNDSEMKPVTSYFFPSPPVKGKPPSTPGRENKKIRNRIAEHAEVIMAKAQGPGGKERNGPISDASRKAQKAPRDFQEEISALLVSSSFIFYLLFLIHGGTGERKISIPQNEKATTNRRDPGGRKKDQVFMK